MNYANVVTAFRDATVGDGTAVALLVEARASTGFNADTFMLGIDAMLIELVLDGFLADNSAKTKTSMIRKLANCGLDVLVDAAAVAQGLNAVYRAVNDASPKTSNKGAKRKTAAIAVADAAIAAGTNEMISLMDVLVRMQEIRNVILPKMTSDMGLLEDCDAFMATLRAKVGAGKAK